MKTTISVDIKELHKELRKPTAKRGVVMMKPKKGKGSYKRSKVKE